MQSFAFERKKLDLIEINTPLVRFDWSQLHVWFLICYMVIFCTKVQ